MPAQILSGTTSASAFITASAAVLICVRASAERGNRLNSVPSFATTLIGRKIPSFCGMNSSKRASSRKIDRTIV